ncbi:MAG: hypothetical protein RBR97_07140 [Bacteroidales bacterium]|nr:hypothetical protein [Bacteroidales bacterium]
MIKELKQAILDCENGKEVDDCLIAEAEDLLDELREEEKVQAEFLSNKPFVDHDCDDLVEANRKLEKRISNIEYYLDELKEFTYKSTLARVEQTNKISMKGIIYD